MSISNRVAERLAAGRASASSGVSRGVSKPSAPLPPARSTAHEPSRFGIYDQRPTQEQQQQWLHGTPPPPARTPVSQPAGHSQPAGSTPQGLVGNDGILRGLGGAALAAQGLPSGVDGRFGIFRSVDEPDDRGSALAGVMDRFRQRGAEQPEVTDSRNLLSGLMDRFGQREAEPVESMPVLQRMIDSIRGGGEVRDLPGAGAYSRHAMPETSGVRQLSPEFEQYFSNIGMDYPGNMQFELSPGSSYFYADRRGQDWASLDYHPGIDLRSAHGHTHGAPLPAPVDGQVVSVGYDGSRGNYVAIADRQGNLHVYMHMDNVGVSEGQRVNQWDFVGQLGATGAGAAHLDYRVYDRSGNLVNPHQFASGVLYPEVYPQDWVNADKVGYLLDTPQQPLYDPYRAYGQW